MSYIWLWLANQIARSVYSFGVSVIKADNCIVRLIDVATFAWNVSPVMVRTGTPAHSTSKVVVCPQHCHVSSERSVSEDRLTYSSFPTLSEKKILFLRSTGALLRRFVQHGSVNEHIQRTESGTAFSI